MTPTTINSFLSIDKMWWGTTLANKHLKSCIDHECLHDCPNNNLQLGTEWEFVVAVPQDHLNSPCLLYIFCGLCLFFKHCEYSELIQCEYQPMAFSRLSIIWTYILPNFISSVFICAAGCLHWHRGRRLCFTSTNTGRRQWAVFQPEIISTCCHRRKRVCFGAAGLCPTCGYSSPAMCSVIVPTTDIMSTAESQVENSGQEEELKGTKRKISLFK